ncbi:helix-turn-helix domain-containing protein [Cognatilysobacter bugurensis]|uniref:Membrane protein n=1 Tax=Cognatilysobacter bugurensis TaxID=543356 RepID=A0A918SYY3_9GAMM|nr:helix-turn-helix domain-containing protein [Lysobacter bugurensis]GHA74175.1 membrane protein [Lysobacter bugurensis]
MTQVTEFGSDDGTAFGARLQQSREAAGLSIEEVCRQLRMPARVVASLESGHWAALGAPIFVRGQLRSYARLLEIELPESIDSALQPKVAAAPLVSYTHTPRYRRLAEQAGRRAIYIVLTVTLVAPVWMATRPHLSKSLAPTQSLDLPSQLTSEPTARPSQRGPVERRPLVASMAALPDTRAPAPAMLSLRLTGDSWVEVLAHDGSLIERALLVGGQSRSYELQRVGRVLLGNTKAVEVLHAGEAVDLAPFSRANVARFALSSDGSLAPVAH